MRRDETLPILLRQKITNISNPSCSERQCLLAMWFQPWYPALSHPCVPAPLLVWLEGETPPVPAPEPVPFPIVLGERFEYKGRGRGLAASWAPHWHTSAATAADSAPHSWGCRLHVPGSGRAQALVRHRHGSTRLASRVGRSTSSPASLQPGTRHLQPTERSAATLPLGFLQLGQRKEFFLLKHTAVSAVPRTQQFQLGWGLNLEVSGQRCWCERNRRRAPRQAVLVRCHQPALKSWGSSMAQSKLHYHIYYTLVYFCIVLGGVYRIKVMYYLWEIIINQYQ